MTRSEKAKLIAHEWQDEDGYWIALKSGWQDSNNPQCHTIHEDTKREAYAVFDPIPCDCRECKQDAQMSQWDVR